MIAIGHPRLIAGEDGVGDPVREYAETEDRVMTETRHEDTGQTLHARWFGAQFLIVFHPRGGETGGEFAVDESGASERLVDLCKLSGIEQFWDREEHGEILFAI